MKDTEKTILDDHKTQSTTVKSSGSLDGELNKFIQAKCLIPGGLGVWEVYFRKICNAWGRIDDTIRPHHIIFAADNGCNMEGYVGYNYEVTQKQTRNMVLGNTAATHFCTFNHIPYEVVDVGIASDISIVRGGISNHDILDAVNTGDGSVSSGHNDSVESSIGVDRKVAKGTKNILNAPAMTADEFERAFAAGRERVLHYIDEDINLFSFGEMGLGNTTTSACVLSALTGRSVEETVGPGSWPNQPDLMKRKRDFVSAVLETHKEHFDTVSHIIARVGGFDIAALTGAMVACAERSIPFVIDGFISAVAAACAVRLNPDVKKVAIPSHHSRETGMEIALNEVGLTVRDVPIQAHMAMGEGTGAILMVQMLKTTQYMFVNVGTFADMMKL